ncbi:MAG: pseudouridine synthase [Planctomycetota bacterium]
MSTPPPGPLTVLHEDAELIAVAKPPWLLVHRSKDAPDRDVALQRVRDQTGALVYPVHRLDRQASGVLLFAKHPEAARALQGAWDDARKDYLTLVRGETPEAWTIERPLRMRKHALRPEGDATQPASTRLVRVAHFARSTLLIASLETGRRHQIRRHLSGEARQILGDRRYGKSKINDHHRSHWGLERLFLHAWRLTVAHPAGGVLEVEAPLAPDLLAYLRRVPDVPPEVWALVAPEETP